MILNFTADVVVRSNDRLKIVQLIYHLVVVTVN